MTIIQSCSTASPGAVNWAASLHWPIRPPAQPTPARMVRQGHSYPSNLHSGDQILSLGVTPYGPAGMRQPGLPLRLAASLPLGDVRSPSRSVIVVRLQSESAVTNSTG